MSRIARAGKIKAYRKEKRDEHRVGERRRMYGISAEEFAELAESQEHVCAICGESGDLLQVDHDHLTGEIRGLLCRHCNSGLGRFRDSPEFLERAIAYLVPADPLERVARATRRKAAADQEYRGALQAARASGAPVPSIARAAGITRQAVYKLTRP